jgi:DNA-binding response OmpR family regulator
MEMPDVVLRRSIREGLLVRILAVEDDRPLLEAIARVFREAGFQVDEAEEGEEGLYMAEQSIYDLLVLDIMLPGLDGLSIVRRLRKKRNRTPILLLTAKDSVEDRVSGLDVGADDYLVKPFAIPELLARSRALLRRKSGFACEEKLVCDRLALYPQRKEARYRNEPLQLTLKEFQLLEYLMMNAGQILTREQIFDRIWGFDSETGCGIVDLYIHYLRKKLSPYGGEHLIRTVRGVGFMLRGNADVSKNAAASHRS